MAVELHDDHFPQDAKDADWLPDVGARGWVVLTKDKRIRKRPDELAAVRAACVRMFVLSTGRGLSGEGMARVFLDSRARMERFIRKTPAPFIAGVSGKQVKLFEMPPEGC